VIPQNVCTYEDLLVKPTGMFVKWLKHESSKRILRIIHTYFSLKYFLSSVLGRSAQDYGDRKENHWSTHIRTPCRKFLAMPLFAMLWRWVIRQTNSCTLMNSLAEVIVANYNKLQTTCRISVSGDLHIYLICRMPSNMLYFTSIFNNSLLA